MVSARGAVLAPLAAAVLAAATVVLIVLISRSGGGADPFPPAPVGPIPEPLDRVGLSLDRCASALDAAALADRYPDRAAWRPLVQLTVEDRQVTMVESDVPFVCATGPATVEVSDPLAAVPIGQVLLLLSSADGVVAAVAPEGERVEVAAVGGPEPGFAATRHFIRVLPDPVADPAGLAVVIGDSTGTRVLGAPSRLAPPAVRVVDRRSAPPDRSAAAARLLRLCSAQPGAEPSRPWETAQVVAYRRGDQPASLLVAVGPSGVGGCSVAPGEITPLRAWPAGNGARPWTWLPAPGTSLPDLGVDIAAGSVRPEVVRMEITARGGQRWHASVAGGTFATQLPAGVPADARELTVRAYDADDHLVGEGPAAG
jgi:hypothetical protein